MARDRLADLTGGTGGGGSTGGGASSGSGGGSEPTNTKTGPVQETAAGSAFFDQLGEIKSQITRIKQSVEQIEGLHGKALNAVTDEQGTQYAKELEKVMNETNKSCQAVKNKLKAMEAENAKLKGKNEGEFRMRSNQHGAVLKSFMDVMSRYKDVQKMYQEKYKQRMKRQFLIVKPNATETEVEKVVESGEAGQIFAQNILVSGQQLEARRALQDIQQRHQDLVRIERSIIELQQLFMDMAVLVSAQGEVINHIELQVNNAVDNTEAGVKALTAANKKQRSARKKKCAIAALLIGVLIALALVFGLVFGGKK